MDFISLSCQIFLEKMSNVSHREKCSKTPNLYTTKEQYESYENAKICYICKEKFEDKYAKDKKYHKVRDNCHYIGEYRGSAHSICNLK